MAHDSRVVADDDCRMTYDGDLEEGRSGQVYFADLHNQRKLGDSVHGLALPKHLGKDNVKFMTSRVVFTITTASWQVYHFPTPVRELLAAA